MAENENDRHPVARKNPDALRRTTRVVMRRRGETDAEAAAAQRAASGVGAVVAPAVLTRKLDHLSFAIEKMNLAEYTKLLDSPWRLMWVNFMAGASRWCGYGCRLLCVRRVHPVSAAKGDCGPPA